MATYAKPTGNAGVMRVDDDEVVYVDFLLLGVNQLVSGIPWRYTLNGVVSVWNSFTLEANVAWQQVAHLQVDVTQTVTFSLGASGNVTLGGPTDFSVDITRVILPPSGTRIMKVKVGNVYRDANPYVNDKGIWKPAEPWGRIAGEWKPSV